MTARPSDPMGAGVYRDGKVLYVSRSGRLPALCIRCAKPVDGKPLKMKYSWHPWAIYLLFPFKFVLPLGDKIYDAITHLAGEELDLEVYVCPRHRDNRVLIALLGMTIWLAGLITAIVFIDHNGMLYGLLLFVIANVCVRLLAITPRPTYIGERYGTFRGTAAAFLDQLQPKPRLWMPTVLNL